MRKTGIALFVYKRPIHTQKVLEGLKKNGIDHLYIFADAARDKNDEEMVQRVRQCIESIDWCKTEIIRSDRNKGLAESEISGIGYILERHERVIVLEDDCIPAPDFIDFMEQCLDRYDNDGQVMTVGGYALPISISRSYPYDIYFTYRMGGWGQAMWRRSWKSFKRDPDDFTKIVNSREFRRKIDRGGRDLFYMFKQQIEGKLDSVGIWWTWHILKNEGVCVVPVRSRVDNIGHDGTGRHCEITGKYRIQLQETEFHQKIKFPPRIEVVKEINRRYNEFMGGSLSQRAKIKLLKLFPVLSGTK